MKALVLLYVCIQCNLLTSATERTVTTKVGSIMGQSKTVNIDNVNKDIYEFLGIPFAEPPLGSQRFMKPVPKANFTETFNASMYGLPCTQYATGGLYITIRVPEVTSEDCLTLNIHTPNTGGSDSFPVMVFIHGGGNEVGMSSSYSGDKLTAYGEVVVVTFNYRVGAFGFLSTGDDNAPGNAALWDQQLALKWVKMNIESFGGNPSKITLFGESAGAGSVNYQMLHAGNVGLFHRAIAESGSVNNMWTASTPQQAYDTAKQLADKLKCSLPAEKNSAALLECLRNVANATEIAKHAEAIRFNPRVDEQFATSDSIVSIAWPAVAHNNRSYQNYDLIVGTNGYEGHYFLSTMFYAITSSIKKSNSTESRKTFRNYVTSSMAIMRQDKKTLEAIVDAIMFLYTNAENPNDVSYNLKQLNDFLTDMWFFTPAFKDANIHSYLNRNNNTFQYEFNHAFPYASIGKDWLHGATHAMELLYVFGFSSSLTDIFNFTQEQAASEWDTAKSVMDYWTNFAKTGDPNKPRSVQAMWKPFDSDAQNYIYFPMTGNATAKRYLNARRATFWIDQLPMVMKTSFTPPCEQPTSNTQLIHGCTMYILITTILICVIEHFNFV